MSALPLGPFTLRPLIRDGAFAGLGDVLYRDTPLRSPALPWTFYTESESGWRFDRFAWTGSECSPDSVTLRFLARGEWLPRLQEADAMGDSRIKTRRVDAPVAEFSWTFRLIRERIAEHEWDGLAMQLRVSSPENPIHWLIEDTTWEIGGRADGCTLIQQDVSTIDLEQTVHSGSSFSTIEKFFTEGWGGAYPMDMLPRAAGSAICDFQTKGRLALCLFAENPSLTRARLEKFADEDVIHYTDRPFFPLTENAVTPERKLLVFQANAPLARHEWRNLWLDTFTEVRSRILGPFGFQAEIPRPAVHAHLWDEDLKTLGPDWTRPLADDFAEYERLGYREVITHGVWDSITSDPAPPAKGNICCPYQFAFAESFGGDAGMKTLSDEARRHGLTLFQWFSFHLSRHAPVWKEHPDWLLREANGDPWDANYETLWSGRFRSPYAEWTKKLTFQTCRDAALGGIFWDSYQNLGVTCVDWSAPDKAPQADEIRRFQAELQQRGLRQRCEVVTIFGVSQVAVYGFENDKFRRRLWADTEAHDDIFALLDCAPAFFSDSYPFTADRVSPERYFWMLGHRVVPQVNALPWKEVLHHDGASTAALPGGDQAEEYGEVNRLYNRVLPHMHRLRLVENGAHVLWLDADNRPAVVWVFRPTETTFPEPARELRGGGRADAGKPHPLRPGEVWLVGTRSDP